MSGFRHLGKAAAALAVLGALALACEVTRQTASACQIKWDGVNNPTLQAAAGTGAFGNAGSPFELDTATVIDEPSEDPFDLYLAYGSGGSSNISTCSVSPSFFEDVGDTDSMSHITGILANPSADGTAYIAAWNGTTWACTGDHYRNVEHN